MKVLVCGARDWTNLSLEYGILYRLLDLVGDGLTIVEGAAPGADVIAGDWARDVGVRLLEYSAHWRYLGRGAGPIRNRTMLDDNPDVALVVAFHDNLSKSKGTMDMVTRAEMAGIPVVVFP